MWLQMRLQMWLRMWLQIGPRQPRVGPLHLYEKVPAVLSTTRRDHKSTVISRRTRRGSKGGPASRLITEINYGD